jgi:biotin-dependent carboxylase-like uncharacterized protein
VAAVTAALRLRKPGLLTTVQDLGRRGYEHWGVTVGGALDEYAARWANRLVHNAEDSALLEITILGPELEVEGDVLVGLAGADLGAEVDGRRWDPGSSAHVAGGSVIRFRGPLRGARAYLAVAGGIDVEPVLGSRSTDVEAAFGGFAGRPLKAGDRLPIGPPSGGQPSVATASTLWRPAAVGIWVREGMPGEALTGRDFTVSPRSNRVGLRLEERVALATAPSGTDVSEGMAIGSIEITAGGEILVLLKARGSVGGYPVLGYVPSPYWPALAQLRPGESVRFVEEAPEVSALIRRKLWSQLEAPLVSYGEGFPRTLPAPASGRVARVDPAFRPGERLEAGQTVAQIVGEDGRAIDVRSPGNGRVLVGPPEAGVMVQAGDPLGWWLEDHPSAGRSTPRPGG